MKPVALVLFPEHESRVELEEISHESGLEFRAARDDRVVSRHDPSPSGMAYLVGQRSHREQDRADPHDRQGTRS